MAEIFLGNIGVPSADHIVARDVSGNWTYRKWASGDAECWMYRRVGISDCEIEGIVTINGRNYGSGIFKTPVPFQFLNPDAGVGSTPIIVNAGVNDMYNNSLFDGYFFESPWADDEDGTGEITFNQALNIYFHFTFDDSDGNGNMDYPDEVPNVEVILYAHLIGRWK